VGAEAPKASATESANSFVESKNKQNRDGKASAKVAPEPVKPKGEESEKVEYVDNSSDIDSDSDDSVALDLLLKRVTQLINPDADPYSANALTKEDAQPALETRSAEATAPHVSSSAVPATPKTDVSFVTLAVAPAVAEVNAVVDISERPDLSTDSEPNS
jgi:hypothetical protein